MQSHHQNVCTYYSTMVPYETFCLQRFLPVLCMLTYFGTIEREVMKLEVLMSCMGQTDVTLVRRAGLCGDVLMISQGGTCGQWEFPTPHGTTRLFAVPGKGLTVSRNLAIAQAKGDVCLLCDDDEQFVPNYESLILNAYAQNPDADLIIFKMTNYPARFPDAPRWLKGVDLMRVASWQISFNRQRLLSSGVRFDELLGAGSGNGAEEELKFLTDCRRAGLRILYLPIEIAAVAQCASTWFHGFDATFFENRGATTRYILGLPLSLAYGAYYIFAKRHIYAKDILPLQAAHALLRGIFENRITHQAAARTANRKESSS